MRIRKNYSNVLAIALVVIATYSGSAFATDIPNKYSGSEYTYSGLGTLKDDNGQTIDKFYEWEKDTTFDFYKLKQTSNSSIADIITKEIDDRSYGGDGDVIPGWTYDSKKMNGVVFSGIGDTANMFATGQTGDGKMDEINAVYISNYNGAFPVGGAISNNMKIGDINSSFIGNFVTGRKDYSIANNTFNGSAYGGAIYNSRANVYYAIGAETPNAIGYINSIKGDFVANYVYSQYATSDNLAYTATYDNVYYYYEGALGGAIANQFGTINDILDSKFIQNGAFATGESGDVGGSAIYNGFLALYSYDYGWIASESKIGNISNSTFEKNLAYSENGNVYGGTILNFIGLKESSGESKISNIIENTFEENKAIANNGSIKGAVLANWNYSSKGHAIIDKISSDFINNNAIAGGNIEGTIYNNDIINEIENSKFKNNTIISTGNSSTVSGGAIYNKGSITDGIINSSFINNSATAENGTALGGAIYSSKDLTIIADNFTSEIKNNYTEDKNGKNGNSIYIDNPDATLTLNAKNNGTIFLQNGFNKESGEYNYGNINGKSGFNTILTTENSGTIKLYDDILNSNVTIQNALKIDTADGITHDYNMDKITSSNDAKYTIDVDLSSTPNYAPNDSNIYKTADRFVTTNNSAGSITLEHLNLVNDKSTWEQLLQNYQNKNIIVQVIKNNDDNSSLDLKLAGELSNLTDIKLAEKVTTSSIKNIEAVVRYSDKFGAIKETKVLKGDIGLYDVNSSDKASNDSISITLKDIITSTVGGDGDTLQLLNNYVLKSSEPEKIFKLYDGEGDSKTVANYTATENLGETTSGIFNINGVTQNGIQSKIDLDNHSGFELTKETSLNFNNVTITNAKNNDIVVVKNDNANINLEDSNIIGNLIADTTLSNNFKLNVIGDNSVTGTIQNADINLYNGDSTNLKLTDSTVIGSILGTNNEKITLTNSNNIQADIKNIQLVNNGNSTISGNVSITNLTNDGILKIGSTTPSVFNIDKSITTSDAQTQGNLELNNILFNQNGKIENQNLAITNNSIVNLNNPNLLINNSLDLNNSTINVPSLGLGGLNFNNFASNSAKINISNVDVDINKEVMGRLTANNYGAIVNSSVNVNNLNISGITTKTNINILFADNSDLAKSVNYNGSDTYMSPIYKYNVGYNKNTGFFNFVVNGGSGGSNNFNPSVMNSSVNSQAGSYVALNETFNYAFRHADYTFMPLPRRVRTSLTNRYAISDGQTLPYELEYSKRAGVWIQPYASFEKVGLLNGPNVEIQSYGTLIGGDSHYRPLKNNWGTVTTPYFGYNGTSQHYSGVSTYTNGGVLGLTQTFYKNDFFTAITISTGASVGESHTMYGTDNFTSLMAGVASKTGYNFEFKSGKLIIQPSWLMSYSYINTFDYTNAAGVKITSDPLHSIQLRPNIKFMGNIGNGWQPYFQVSMVWNILNKTNVRANDVRLPEMSIKPYVEYGLGVQKSWEDRFTAFVQAMIRQGGRNGVALSVGCKLSLGKDSKPIERVQNNIKVASKQSNINSKFNILTPQEITQRANSMGFNRIN